MSYFRAGAENCCEICLSACCTIVLHPLELERLLQHIVARLPEHRSPLPAIAYVSIHEYLSSPSVPIFIHTSPWLVDFAWLVWLHRPHEDTRRSLKSLLGYQMFGVYRQRNQVYHQCIPSIQRCGGTMLFAQHTQPGDPHEDLPSPAT